MAEAELAGATKRFGDTVAVEALSLTVADRETVVLLGPTGAGKTTTLRLFAGLERPDTGRVRIAGADVTELAPAERDVAFVFQQYSLYPHYSVFDNLAFPLRAPGRRLPEEAIRARVGEVAEMLRIAHKLKNRATHLSGGEMQRVSIGRALVRQPNLFLMDEPLSSLDAKLREELRAELRRIQRELGATVLYVTHDQLEAMTLADRIGILEHGRLVQLAPPRVVYERPATVAAARRLGSPPINLFAPGGLGTAARADAATAAVRPEDIVLGAGEVLGAGGRDGKIVNLEHLGAENVALVEADGLRLHALLDPGSGVAEGEATRVSVRPGRVLWFDRDDRLME